MKNHTRNLSLSVGILFVVGLAWILGDRSCSRPPRTPPPPAPAHSPLIAAYSLSQP